MGKRSDSESSSSSSETSSSRSRSRSERKKYSRRDKDSKKSRKNYKHRDDKKKKRRHSSSASSESSSRSKSRSRSSERSRSKHKKKTGTRSRSKSDEKRKEKKPIKSPSPQKKNQHMTEEEIQREKERKRQIRLAKVKALKYERDDVVENPYNTMQSGPQEEVKESPQDKTATRIGIMDELEMGDEDDKASTTQQTPKVGPAASDGKIFLEESSFIAIDEEEDPLEAYMKTINRNLFFSSSFIFLEEAAQQVLESLDKEKPVEEFKAPEAQHEPKVITLEDLQKLRMNFSLLFLI